MPQWALQSHLRKHTAKPGNDAKEEWRQQRATCHQRDFINSIVKYCQSRLQSRKYERQGEIWKRGNALKRKSCDKKTYGSNIETLLKGPLSPNWKEDMTVLVSEEKAEKSLQEIQMSTPDKIEGYHPENAQIVGWTKFPNILQTRNCKVSRGKEPRRKQRKTTI